MVDNEPDLSSMTKEEIAAYYKRQLEAQQNVISGLRRSVSEKAHKIVILENDNDKLKINNNNFKTLNKDVLSMIRDSGLSYHKLLNAEYVSNLDINNIKELYEYYAELVPMLLQSVSTLMFQQKRALNLGTSEKNHGADYVEKHEADRETEEYGKDELQSADEIYTADYEEKDFKEVSEEFETSSVLSPSDDCTKALESGLSAGAAKDTQTVLNSTTAIINALESNIKDTPYHNEGVVSQREPIITTAGDGGLITGVITSGDKELTMCCPQCGKLTRFSIESKSGRINDVLTLGKNLSSVESVLAVVNTAVCSECGCSVELNPAGTTNFTVTTASDNKQSTNSTQTNNGQDTDKQKAESESKGKTAEESHSSTLVSVSADSKQTKTENDYHKEHLLRQKERRHELNKIKHDGKSVTASVNLNNEMMDACDTRVINPLMFKAESFSLTPAFIKSKFSVALLASCGTIFCQLGAPKNRVYNFFEGLGLPVSRAQLTGGINAFARAFLHPVADKIHDDIVKQCPAVLMDESTLLVRESADRKKNLGKGRKSQIWALVSGWTSDIKAAWYSVSDSRSHENVVDILKDAGDLKYVISDGYSGYDKGLKVLEQECGISLKSARCWTHSRRPLHRYLEDSGLLKIYNDKLLPKGAAFSDFSENLDKYLNTKEGKKLTDVSKQLLIIYYLINALFVIDSSVVRRHSFICNTEEFKQDLLKERQEKSLRVVNAIFDSIRLLILQHQEIMDVKVNSRGNIRYKAVNRYPVSRALIYLLRFEKQLKVFTSSADVELSQSGAERSLKLGICSRKSFMFLQSEDGGHAFADFQTVVNTCMMNKVPVQPYLMWLVANIKLRMDKMRKDGHDDPTFFTMPGKRAVIINGTDPTEKLGMYDARNKWGYDRVDVSGLTPYDYRSCIERQRSSL